MVDISGILEDWHKSVSGQLSISQIINQLGNQVLPLFTDGLIIKLINWFDEVGTINIPILQRGYSHREVQYPPKVAQLISSRSIKSRQSRPWVMLFTITPT